MRDGLVKGPDGRVRRWWCSGGGDYRRYHDTERGFPVRDGRETGKAALTADRQP